MGVETMDCEGHQAEGRGISPQQPKETGGKGKMIPSAAKKSRPLLQLAHA